ncbi:MAG TPA: hypothetical protein PLV43_11600 [Aequorivita sp.]|nr:hypothetical protein [Aequorivita sp.]
MIKNLLTMIKLKENFKKYLLLAIGIIIFFSCKENKEIILEYYDSGQIEQKYELRNGSRHGKIESFFLNGNFKMKGHYKYGKEDGLWLHFHPNGDLSDSSLYNMGKIVFIYSFDTNKHITMKNGNGYRISIDEISGNIEKLYYNNYVPDGIYQEWYPNGSLYCSGFYRDGKPTGIWKYFDNEGVIINEVLHEK